jgi:hypothetical protein
MKRFIGILACAFACSRSQAPAPDPEPQSPAPSSETVPKGVEPKGVEPKGSDEPSAGVAFYYLDEEIVRTRHCEATAVVSRVLAGSPPSTDDVLRTLFRGPTQAERAKGIISVFEQSPSDPGAGPLADYFLRAEADGKTVRLHFEARAMAYLNAAACVQIGTKTSIERTLRDFGDFREFVYVVDGVVVTEWDA